jgi:hypothetical protein
MRLHAALGLALAELAESNPRPELAALVTQLRDMSADPITKDDYLRDSFRIAADRIEEAAVPASNLPLVVSDPTTDRSTLPGVADRVVSRLEGLPRVRD